MFAVIRLFAVIVLAIIVGAASVHFGFFPGKSLSNAFIGFDALKKQLDSQENELNAGTVHYAGSLRGVSIWDQDQALEGYTVVPVGIGDTVDLINMAGETVHSWTANYYDIWDDSGDVQNPVPERFIYTRKAKVYPDGRLLVIFSAWSTTPYGYGIAMLDKDSNVLWKDFRNIHHSFDQAADGTIYALDQGIVSEMRADLPTVIPPYLDDGIAIYSGDGQFIKRFSLLDAFQQSSFVDVIALLVARNTGQGFGDALHANDVDVLSEEMADAFPFAESGDLLVSLRDITSLAIVDPELEVVKWFQKGYWHGQHDGDFLANGHMLVFDNYTFDRNIAGERASRVIEFDPVNMEIVWEYKQLGEGRFFTAARGSQQRLVNGNTLITESHSARVFEVNPSGEIVWQYHSTNQPGGREDLVSAVFWATRYTSEQLEFLAE